LRERKGKEQYTHTPVYNCKAKGNRERKRVCEREREGVCMGKREIERGCERE
jgi:hypothetical protein